jgi:hypothetical protein
MRLSAKFITRRFHGVQRSGRQQIRRRPYLVPVYGLVLGVVIVLTMVYTRGQPYRPSDSHVVFVFDSGQKRTVDTKASTVGALIKRLNLHLIAQDVVEPTPDSR